MKVVTMRQKSLENSIEKSDLKYVSRPILRDRDYMPCITYAYALH